MAMVSSQERKEQQWRQLLQGAGLKILKIRSYEPSVESLIECELAWKVGCGQNFPKRDATREEER
ncbi:hypothetical protein VTN77DRAFT_6254 [Rasamsonia byssochlamydoides]|uniref:uncharacterized protein n=1 Tax=Rasamsonia byssochlamydoides TaxID=89139 RepID=UPI0037427534